eukprot:CAMPEP_0115095526 /NCGR_PEP_ID=MMETSP0227-20121206/29106_1 /TAXON_ID=89957 /ORGANISM="Polarella glacialis, Strain CCMP 1383" /LENGTH=127 /DNA_ID=CAMNT_0002488937 /DNA_START=94 /DNA_END=477 /DNA_ORIENTATION=+
MGVASIDQVKHAKKEKRAQAGKGGKHCRILTLKKNKLAKNQDRHKRKKETETKKSEAERGRSGASGSAEAVADTSMRTRSKSAPVKLGHGSGSVGARFAARQVPKAVQVSSRGGRRLKPTWRSFGHR